LFRRSAVENAGTRRLGVIVLVRPTSYSHLTLLFSAIALAIVVFVALFSCARTAQVQGIIRPTKGLVRVVATQGGIVVERPVSEGQAVSVNDVLFVTVMDRSSSTGGNAAEEVSGLLRSQRQTLSADRDLMRQQAAHRAATLQVHAGELGADPGRIDQQLDIQRRRIALFDERMKHLVDLRAEGFVSLTQIQELESQLLEQREHLLDLQRSKASIQRDLSGVRSDLVDLRVQSERDSVNSERDSFDIERKLTENEASRRTLVRASSQGLVTGLMAEPGQAVSTGDTLLSIVPAGSEFEAELYAPSNAVGFLKVGQKVRLRYQAFPYQKFGQHGGVIREISAAALPLEELGERIATSSRPPSREPIYRVRVSLDEQTVKAFGVNQRLKAGMLVDASVMLERRKLYEWILDPLYTIEGRH